MFKLYNPLDFNDPVNYAIPGFVLMVLAEWYILVVRRRQSMDYKDAFSSITLGIGAVGVDFAMKAIFVGLFLWIYQFRIFENLGPKDVEEFFTLQWHRENWWVWILVLIGDDFTFYWYHRWMHEIRFFWAMHVNHHDSRMLTYATALRQSWTEYLFKYQLWFWMPLLGFHPFMVVTMIQISLIYQFWPHTEIIQKMGWFDRIFNSPANHRVHHASNVQYLDRNYGAILMLWDRLFGTWEPEVEKPKYGITKNITTNNPFKITAHEWVNIWADIKRANKFSDKLKYLFHSPGWSHDGPDLRARTLRKTTKSS